MHPLFTDMSGKNILTLSVNVFVGDNIIITFQTQKKGKNCKEFHIS